MRKHPISNFVGARKKAFVAVYYLDINLGKSARRGGRTKKVPYQGRARFSIEKKRGLDSKGKKK